MGLGGSHGGDGAGVVAGIGGLVAMRVGEV